MKSAELEFWSMKQKLTVNMSVNDLKNEKDFLVIRICSWHNYIALRQSKTIQALKDSVGLTIIHHVPVSFDLSADLSTSDHNCTDSTFPCRRTVVIVLVKAPKTLLDIAVITGTAGAHMARSSIKHESAAIKAVSHLQSTYNHECLLGPESFKQLCTHVDAERTERRGAERIWQ